MDRRAGFQAFVQTKTFGSLDGLRAFSIAAVVWHHTAARFFHDVPLFQMGNKGVNFFFAISGFLITTLLLREKDRSGSISLKKFYARRSLRIFPLYYGVLLVYCVLVAVLEGGSARGAAFWTHLPYYLTYTSNWFVGLGDEAIIFYFAWSLATEEQFYLVWPSVERFLGGVRAVLLACVLVAVSFGAHAAASGLDGPIPFGVRVAGSVALSICIGVIAAHALHHRATFRVVWAALGHRWSSLLAVTLTAVAFWAAPALGIWSHLVIDFMLVVTVVSCVVREDHWLGPWLRLRPIAWVGVVSYGVYMFHMLAKNLVSRAVGQALGDQPLLEFLAVLSVAVFAATLSHQYFESFFLKAKARFSVP